MKIPTLQHTTHMEVLFCDRRIAYTLVVSRPLLTSLHTYAVVRVRSITQNDLHRPLYNQFSVHLDPGTEKKFKKFINLSGFLHLIFLVKMFSLMAPLNCPVIMCSNHNLGTTVY